MSGYTPLNQIVVHHGMIKYQLLTNVLSKQYICLAALETETPVAQRAFAAPRNVEPEIRTEVLKIIPS